MSETYTHTVGGFAVKMPFHPDDVLTALGVLRHHLPIDCSTAAAEARIEEAFNRALLTLTAQGQRRFEREGLDAQYRYEQARGGEPSRGETAYETFSRLASGVAK